MNNDLPLPVLFLDMDDVVCLNAPYGAFDVIEVFKETHAEPLLVFPGLFSPAACAVLQRVHDELGGQLRYVISSTWREAFDRDHMQLVLREGGLGFVARALHAHDRWCTPINGYQGKRSAEIAEWLDRHHSGEAFAVADDLLSGASLLGATTSPGHPFYGRVVLCEEDVGLRDAHARVLIEALSNPVQRPQGGRR